jgi:hypothetical protein
MSPRAGRRKADLDRRARMIRRKRKTVAKR